MTDITKCRDQECPKRSVCYRQTAKDGYWQSYYTVSPRRKAGCDEFCLDDNALREDIIGVPREEAIKKVESLGLECVVFNSGKSAVMAANFDPSRVRLTIKNGLVKSLSTG